MMRSSYFVVYFFHFIFRFNFAILSLWIPLEVGNPRVSVKLTGFVYYYLTSNGMDIKDVENLAELARIDLSREEKEKILKDMGGILDYVKQIEEVKIEDIKSEIGLQNIWREDELVSREFSRELIIGQFPDSQDGFLKVKKIL